MPKTLAKCDIRVLEKHKNSHFSCFLIRVWEWKHHHQLRNRPTPGNLLNTKSHFPPEINKMNKIKLRYKVLKE